MTTLRILHVSDLHFGTKVSENDRSRSAHYFTQRDNGDRPDPQQLARLLRKELDLKSKSSPQLIVASGDVGWSGKTSDYELASEFFTELRKGAPNASLVIAPGNHDVDFMVQDETNEERRQIAFVEFLKGMHGTEFGELYPLYEKRGIRDNLVAVSRVSDGNASIAVVVAFNSAAGLMDKSTPIRIEPFVLSELDDYLKSLPLPENALRICVLHHHLFPFAERPWTHTADTRYTSEGLPDPDLLANSAKLQGWLAQHKFHVVLHGHKHTSHGREDLLWRRSDSSGRRLLVIGAGSAGVEDQHRAHEEPLSFNYVTATRLSNERWQVDVEVRRIAVDVGTPNVVPFYAFRSVAGSQAGDADSFSIFRAENMDDCHRAIDLAMREQKPRVQQPFLSVVENPRYLHPNTARFGEKQADQGQVENCFLQLHPEYDEKMGWDTGSYDHRLHQARLRYRFEHGSRLFGNQERWTRRTSDDVRQASPMLRVVDALKLNPSTSKAYVGLYRPEIDISASSQPLPGLMGLQFTKRDSALDVTATFRKIELSFWWCVNMMEIGKILHWVAENVGMNAGRIIFFAALAEWKSDPEAPVEAAIDKMRTSEMIEMVLGLEWHDLAMRLEEKAEFTNENNLDPTGLTGLSEVLIGCKESIGSEKNRYIEVTSHIEEARKAIDKARTSTNNRAFIREAKDALSAAIALLRSPMSNH